MTSPIEHAQAYPFHIPDHSYVIDQDGWKEFDTANFDNHNLHAVIASGSNASPDRLAAKFQDHPELLKYPIYVTQAVLDDFDAVYSAHISNYGSIPATLAHAPGAKAQIFVTWLTNDQLERMHETEALGTNYDYVRLKNITLELENGQTLNKAHAYLSRWGCLNRGETPIALMELKTHGRIWQSMSQSEVLVYAQSLFKSDLDHHSFIQKHIDSEAIRKGRIARLSLSAIEHGWPHTEIIS
ncbi:MAG: hypothetical protein OQK24_12265 [Magnetovibrio sp.]|nr:hypothetical protein [Magnetovibrio sp.]